MKEIIINNVVIPEDIRLLTVKHSRTYDHTDYEDYCLSVYSSKIITMDNDDDMYMYIDSIPELDKYINRLLTLKDKNNGK